MILKPLKLLTFAVITTLITQTTAKAALIYVDVPLFDSELSVNSSLLQINDFLNTPADVNVYKVNSEILGQLNINLISDSGNVPTYLYDVTGINLNSVTGLSVNGGDTHYLAVNKYLEPVYDINNQLTNWKLLVDTDIPVEQVEVPYTMSMQIQQSIPESSLNFGLMAVGLLGIGLTKWRSPKN